MEKETIKPVVLHPEYAETMALPDPLAGVRVTCRHCNGSGCKDDPNCENGTEMLPF